MGNGSFKIAKRCLGKEVRAVIDKPHFLADKD